MIDLTNKVALITGGSRGIGFAIASSLLSQGMRVAITSRDEKNAINAAQELSKDTSKIIGIGADVRSLESQESAVKNIISHFGQLDVLVANAGIGHFASITELTANFFAKGTAYNASKFGLTGFTQALMLDLRQDDVKVTTIMPGSVSSHFGGRSPEDGKDWRIQPEDIGQLTVDLLKMHPRTLPSKVEVRPSKPLSK